MATSEGGARFVAYLHDRRPRIERAIEAALARQATCRLAGASRRDLQRYLYEPLASFVRRGGKRVRPALCLLGAAAVGQDEDKALSSAVALELFQAAALIHDDIADRGELRRGAPCVHVSEGTGIAVNVGDLALTSIYGSVVDDATLDARTTLAILSELVAMANRTLEGQALDLGWVRDGRWDISVDDYLLMARHKTAHYSAATPLVCGALCGGGDASQVEALRTFGLKCGLAFQLQDDLLNLVGDAERQGKDFRSDIVEGKRTLLAVYALSHLGPRDSTELKSLLSSGSTDAKGHARAVGLMEQSGALAYARDLARALSVEACDAISDVGLVPEVLPILTSMASFFVERAE